MSVIARLILLLVVFGWAGVASAACTTAPAATVTFAPSSSYDVRESNVTRVSGSGGFTCNGSVVSILPSNSAQAVATSTNHFTLRNASGNAIAYRLSADSGGNYTFNAGTPVNYFDPALVSLLGVLNSGALSAPVYAALTASPNVPAGTYIDTVTLQWSWQICHGIGVGGVCVSSESGTGTTTITMTLVVGSDCRVSAPNVSFGTAPLAVAFAPVNQAVAVDCTLGSTYTVAFTSGGAPNARPWRRMTGAGGNVLQYNIYRTDGTTIWDESTPLAGAAPGTGALVPAQLQAYIARINPAQATPPPGNYTDTVSVVVSF